MTREGMSGDAAAAREMRILGDILALTLDEQPGAAEAALANVKARAREGGVTAGALKDAWRRLQSATPRAPEAGAPRHDGAGAMAAAAAARTRMELAELQSQVAHAEHLQRQDRVQYAMMLRQARLLATLAGVLAGAAVTALVFGLLRHV